LSILPRLTAIYRNAGLHPLTGHSSKHMHDWADAPFTRFFDGAGIVGCAGLSLFEIMFLEPLRDHLDPKSILVIGNAHGWSTIALALIFPNARIVAIDPDEAGVELTDRLVKANGLSVEVVTAFSPGGVKPACEAHLPGPVELTLIDALHTNEAIKTDFAAAAEVSGPDALYLFHDVINWRMTAGLKEIQQSSGLNAKILTRTPSGMAAVYREIPAGLQEYLDCFTDNMELLNAYRSMVRNTFAADVFGEAIAS
jgi:hypothetical protein